MTAGERRLIESDLDIDHEPLLRETSVVRLTVYYTARPEPVEGRALCSWFDKLTMSGT